MVFGPFGGFTCTVTCCPCDPPPIEHVTPVHVIVSGGGGGAVTVTVAETDFVGLATLLAVTVTAPAANGAVNSPVVVIVPAVADQVTEVFELPVTVAENCCVAPVTMLAAVGLMATTTVVWPPVKVSVTGIDSGVLERMNPFCGVTVNTTESVYVPAVSPAVFAETCSAADVVPPAGETVSHGWLCVVVNGQLQTGTPLGGGHGVESETLNVCAAGFDPPVVPAKVSDVTLGWNT